MRVDRACQVDRLAGGSAERSSSVARRRSTRGRSCGPLPLAELPNLVPVAAGGHRAPLGRVVLRTVVEHGGAHGVADIRGARWNEPSRSARNAVPKSVPIAPRTPVDLGVQPVLVASEADLETGVLAAAFRTSTASWSRGAPVFSYTFVMQRHRARPSAQRKVSAGSAGADRSIRSRPRSQIRMVPGDGGKLSSLPPRVIVQRQEAAHDLQAAGRRS